MNLEEIITGSAEALGCVIGSGRRTRRRGRTHHRRRWVCGAGGGSGTAACSPRSGNKRSAKSNGPVSVHAALDRDELLSSVVALVVAEGVAVTRQVAAVATGHDVGGHPARRHLVERGERACGDRGRDEPRTVRNQCTEPLGVREDLRR